MINKEGFSKKLNVLYLCNIPSPYMVDYLNELGKLCELTAVFERDNSIERGKHWNDFRFVNFKGIILNGIKIGADQSFSPQIIRHFRNLNYDYIVVSNPLTFTGMIAIIFFKMFNIDFIIESEGSFPKNGKGIKELIKKYFISSASYYFSTTKIANDYLKMYGANENRIFKYPYTSLNQNEILAKPLNINEKNLIRKKLKLPSGKIVVAVGRFIPLKNFHILIEMWDHFNPDVSLFLIGEGSEKKRFEELIKRNINKNVYIVDFLKKDKLLEFLKACDLFVHPTTSDVWGLVINEAMACGLPVITTNMCIAGTELVNDTNGRLVEVNNVLEIEKAIQSLIYDNEYLLECAISSIEKIQKYSIEEMAKVHINVLNSLKDND